MVNLPFIKSKYTQSSVLLMVSYSILLLLIFAVLVLVLQQIKDTSYKISTTIIQNNQKSRFLVEMQKAARERSLALYRMVNEKDIFKRDETMIKFSGYAGDFIKARQGFTAMQLSEKEKELINVQGRLSQIAVPIQNKIVELLFQEKLKEASSLLINKSIPAQNAVLSEVSKLIDYQTINNEKIVTQLEKRLDNTLFLLIVTGLVLLLLTLGIGYYVSRRILKSEKQLYIEKELAQTTLKSIGDGVITVDKYYRIQSINPTARYLAGIRDNVIGQNILTLYQDSASDKKTDIDNSMKLNQRSLFDFTLKQPDGTSHEVEHTVAPIIDNFNEIQGAVIVLRDVTEMRSMEKRLSYQASHDPLTGLINRREFEVRLKQAIRNAQSEEIIHSICFLDLDKFKIINDTSGHAAGDEFLKQIAKTINSQLRQTDVLARLGGDEFAIILDSCSIKQAKTIGNQVISVIKDTRFNWGKNSFETGASMGIVPINKYTTSVSDVMSSVDAACYEAKDKGRNRIQVFEPDDADYVKHKNETSWIQKIKKALQDNEFELYYQEIVNINPDYPTPKTIEILIRLRSGDEIVSPDSFIPSAERFEIMPAIDEWVITNTIEFIETYKKKTGSDIRVAINLSGQSLSDDSLLNMITKILRSKRHIDKKLICFEITETSAIANMSRAIEFISSIKQLGCNFSLDDFGSGLSSFSYLRNMPVDNLKIDGIFIRDIENDNINRVFVEAIYNISRTMGIKTTAEYVDNKETFEKIKEIGIDYAQGNYLSEAKPVEDLLKNPTD